MPATDVQLMRRATTGDRAAFAELVRRYQLALTRVAQRQLGAADAAEDAVQETFLAAYKSRHTYDERFGFRTWLWTILLNQCRRSAARQARRQREMSLDTRGLERDHSALEISGAGAENLGGGLSGLLAQERRELLETLLARLSTAEADALRLRFFGGLKFQEIADAMGCTLCTAKNRVRAGLLRISEFVKQQAVEQTAGSDALPQMLSGSHTRGKNPRSAQDKKRKSNDELRRCIRSLDARPIPRGPAC
jgi:RNA polymerase sigma-70 factor (ECF subfamily)